MNVAFPSLLLLAIATLACSSSTSSSAAPDAHDDSQTGGQCHWPDSLNDAGPGACTVGLAYLRCTFESGVGCGATSSPGPLFLGCISNDLTGCPGCDPAVGGTCENMCGANQYALACGGPPGVPGSMTTYQRPPTGCTSMGANPSGAGFYCCPCE
jgi:hypothetical protein